MTLSEFLHRLDAAHWTHFECPVPYATGATRVHAVGAVEIWVVDFFQDGTISADIYRLDGPRGESLRDPARLEEAFGRVRAAWQAAADDLDIRFISPFQLRHPDGHVVECTGLLPDFGGPKGTVITSREDPDEVFELADCFGHFTSGLNPRYYEIYHRARFIETLCDWGWSGEGSPPPWLDGSHAADDTADGR